MFKSPFLLFVPLVLAAPLQKWGGGEEEATDRPLSLNGQREREKGHAGYIVPSQGAEKK